MVEEEFAKIDASEMLTVPQTEIDRISAYFAPPAFETLPADSQAFTQAQADDVDFARFVRANVVAHKQDGYAIINISLKPIGGVHATNRFQRNIDNGIAILLMRHHIGAHKAGKIYIIGLRLRKGLAVGRQGFESGWCEIGADAIDFSLRHGQHFRGVNLGELFFYHAAAW